MTSSETAAPTVPADLAGVLGLAAVLALVALPAARPSGRAIPVASRRLPMAGDSTRDGTLPVVRTP